MTISRAYKFRLYPDKEQENKINSFIGSSRFIYNHYLYNNKNNKFFNLYNAIKDLPRLKTEYEWLKEVDSNILQTSLKDLACAYDKYNKGQAGYPKFKKKGYNGSYRTNAIRGNYKENDYCNIIVDLKARTIKLPKLGKVIIRGYRNIKEFPYKILNVTVSKEANRYYVSVCIEEEIETKDIIPTTAVGIDLGIKTLVTTSYGEKYDKIDISKEEKRIVKLQRKLSRQKKGSNNYNKTRIKIEGLYQKIRNKRKFISHEITTRLVKENDIIITETLKVKEMIMKKEHKLSKYITNSVLSEIIRQLKYKSSWRCKKIVQLSTYYASSQICSHCEYKNKKIKDLSVRSYICPKCGCKNDRDINASVNILYEGIIKYYKELLSV